MGKRANKNREKKGKNQRAKMAGRRCLINLGQLKKPKKRKGQVSKNKERKKDALKKMAKW